ncbi:MAG TPA: GNAT family N-acetyltransferase [Acidimicrobiales bacterium]|nr:GNAT family N-acetyltransferase [Acidimicrobiales bacterium]
MRARATDRDRDRDLDVERVAVEAYDGPTAPDSLLREIFALWQAEDAELRPDDPPYAYEEVEGLYRVADDREVRRRWVARDTSGALVGRADARLPLISNRDLALVEVYVSPDARTAGVGTALVRALLDELEASGRARIRTHIPEGSPGDAYLAARGGTIALTNRKSRMDLTKLDRAMIRSWVEAAERGAGDRYSLRWFSRPPEEDLERYVAVRSMMNTAPRGDLEDEDWRHTPESVLAEADELAAERLQRWSLVVVHDATGDFVGFTEVLFAESAPGHAWQGGTAVRPDHRNHGLGRWLKGAMAERLLAERPAVRFVDTENAYTNEPMLHINLAMGFELAETINDWQASVTDVRAALEAHP